jgi:uncharacterized protein YndB with AHSA1/START domain
MRRRHINVSAVTAAPAETVYGLLADSTTWPRWSPIESVELERQGDVAPEGVGAIRVNRMGRTTGRDEILVLEPNRRLVYATLSGLPIVDYVGEVDLEPAPDGGTVIRWHSSFFPKVRGTGWILQRGLRRFLGRCVHGLAEYAPVASLQESMRPTK